MTWNNMWAKVLTLILLSSIIVLPETSSGFERKPITVVFRYDDYTSKSDTDLEVKLISAFQRYKVPVTFGIVPYVCAGNALDTAPQDVVPLTAVKANLMQNAINSGIVEAAMHGYSHQALGVRSERVNAEFIGLDYDDQFQRIAEGKSLLEEMLGVQVTTFIPPWNSCDINTIRVLEKLGFKSISVGGTGVIAGAANESSRLKFLPQTCRLADLRDAVASARRSSEVQPVIVAIFHEYAFLENDKKLGRLTYEDFVQLLSWVASQEDVHLRTIGEATATMDDLDLPRFISYDRFFSTLRPICPSFLRKVYFYPCYFYPSLATLGEVKTMAWLYLTLFYLVALIISMAIAYIGGCLIFSRLRVLGPIAKYGALVLLVSFSFYVFHDLDIYFEAAIILTCLLGGCIGTWGSFCKIKKQSRLT